MLDLMVLMGRGRRAKKYHLIGSEVHNQPNSKRRCINPESNRGLIEVIQKMATINFTTKPLMLFALLFC